MAMGGLKTVDLGFGDIRMELQTKQGTKVLLDGSLSGRARPGRMLAIMGPSGAGKVCRYIQSSPQFLFLSKRLT
jgi:ABC-type multidrug transport system fused ATPase/permease subunit